MKIGNYIVSDKIGTGGNGVVYKARHSVTGQVVALKVLDKQVDSRRVRNEVRVQASLSHPSIAILLDLLVDKDKQVLVMEYIEGENLQKYLSGRSLSDRQKRALFLKILEPVAYLHQKNIIHRDLKPENIIVQKDGNIKLLDFGIAQGISTPKLTKAGHLVGTIRYAAPERLKGINVKQSDIWSLGAIYYEMLSGERLIHHQNTDLNIKMLNDEHRLFAKLDAIQPFDRAIIKKCLRKDPKKRFQSVEEIKRSLKRTDNSSDYSISKQIPMPGWNKKWLLLPVMFLLAFLIWKFTSQSTPGDTKGPTAIEFKFYPPEAVLTLDDGRTIKNGDKIRGNYGQEMYGWLSAPGYHKDYIVASFNKVKKFERLEYTLKRK